jgi:signal transduction histidine kinase/HPt (histidine-containing phosphotransfer) domain-containing protein/ActR/RegA family two-component response regulator
VYTISMEKRILSETSNTTIYSDILLDLSPNIVFFLDPENSVITMSIVAREYLQIKTEKEAVGKNIFDLVRNPILILLIKGWLEKLNKGLDIDETIPLENQKNDLYQWFQVRAKNVSRDGYVHGKVFFMNDVTDVYSNKKIIDTLMSSIPGEIMVFDRNLQILVVSDAIARANGFHSWRDVAGHSLRDLPKVDLLFVESMIEKSILFDEPTHQVLKYSNAKNDIGWYYADLRTIKSTAGTFGYILTKFDITGEIKPKAILEALMESATDAIIIVNPDGMIEYASKSMVRTLGLDNWRSVVNHPWNYLLRHAPSEIGKFSELLSHDWTHSKKGTVSFDNPEGKTFFNYQVDPLNYQGENFGVITIASNTTELVGACDKAESAVRAKAAFLANMSHELRTPMNAVLGMNELLSRTALSPLQKNYAFHVRSSATMLLSIINDILDFSKIEDSKLTLSPAPYNVNSLLSDVITLVSVKVAEKELSFIVDLDPSIPSILVGDVIRIKQILINLLNNAVKFTNKGEIKLTITAKNSPDYKRTDLHFRIADTGIGIPKAKQSELFNRFTRIENAQNAPVEGSGLGLSICKGLISLMGGTLSLESDEGAGSVFSADFSQPIGQNSAPLTSFSHAGTVSLLAYDTDPYSLDSIRLMAGKAGIHAEFCSSHEEFASRLSGERLSFTHVIFEYRSGYQLAVETASRHPTVKWMTLLSMTDFIASGQDPSIDFIFKPLILPSFARFIQGERVDFSVVLGEESVLGLDPHSFRDADVKVLVVDDSPVNRKVAEGFLLTLDIPMDEAGSGVEAIEMARRTKYDLILLDHMMPVMDGLEAASLLRKIPGYRKTPIIAFTANAGISAVELYRSAGMNDALYKPIEFSAFVACLKKWLPMDRRRPRLPSPAAEVPAREVPPPAVPAGEKWIPGLDLSSGMTYTGSLKNLETILKIFLRTAPKMLEQLESGKRSGNAGQFRVAVHSLISSGANIGAAELSSRARELEDAILAGKNESMERLYPIVHGELEKIIAGVAQNAGNQNDGGKK